MRLPISTVSVLAAFALGTPATPLWGQGEGAREVTLRAGAGPARGYGGDYPNRDLVSFSIALDVATRRGGGSGPLIGVGYSAYSPLSVLVLVACESGPYGCLSRSSFPDLNLGYIDLGWRVAKRGFKADFLAQPTMVLLRRPDVIEMGAGASASISHRLVGPLAIEAAVAATGIPSVHPGRVGITQLTIGLRASSGGRAAGR